MNDTQLQAVALSAMLIGGGLLVALLGSFSGGLFWAMFILGSALILAGGGLYALFAMRLLYQRLNDLSVRDPPRDLS